MAQDSLYNAPFSGNSCDGVTFLHKSLGRPTRGTTPPRQLPPGTPPGCPPTSQDRRRRPPIPKQATAGRHVTTACQSDTTSFSSPPGRYCLPTWRDSPRSYCQLLRECLRLPSNRSRPGITSHRAGTKQQPPRRSFCDFFIVRTGRLLLPTRTGRITPTANQSQLADT